MNRVVNVTVTFQLTNNSPMEKAIEKHESQIGNYY